MPFEPDSVGFVPDKPEPSQTWPQRIMAAGDWLRDTPEFMGAAKGLAGIPATVAGVGAGLGSLAGGGDFGPAFSQGKAEYNADDARVKDSHPVRYGAANFATSMANPLLRLGPAAGGAAFGAQQAADTTDPSLGMLAGSTMMGAGGGQAGALVSDLLSPALTAGANTLWGKVTGATGKVVREDLGGRAGLRDVGAELRSSGVVGPTWNPMTWTRAFRNPAEDIAERATSAINAVDARMSPIYGRAQAAVEGAGQATNPRFQYDPGAVARDVQGRVLGPIRAGGEQTHMVAADAVGDRFNANAVNLVNAHNSPVVGLPAARVHVGQVGKTADQAGAFASPQYEPIRAPMERDAFWAARGELNNKTQAAGEAFGVPEVSQIPDLNRQMHLLIAGRDAAQEASSRTAGHVVPSLRTAAYMAGGMANGDVVGAGKALLTGEALRNWFTPSLASGVELAGNAVKSLPRSGPVISVDAALSGAAEARRKKLGQ